MRYYEYYRLGLVEAFPGSHVVTEDEIREMGERWDPQPFHVDPEAAAASPFGGLVASSVHLFGISTRLGVTKMPPEERPAAVSALGFDKMRLHAPARPGDELTARYSVIERRVSRSRPEIGVVRTENELVNQRSEVVFSYETAWLVTREDPTAPD